MPSTSRTRIPLRTLFAAGLMLVCAQSGCVNSLFMLGKTLVGDPVIPAAFTQVTGVDLAKEDGVKVIVVCSAPDSVVADYDAFRYDLQDELNRRFLLREIEIIPSDDVADVLDEGGGLFDLHRLATGFDADYILHIDVERFSYYEDASESMYRGQAMGNAHAFKVRSNDEAPTLPPAYEVFRREFTVEYPGSHPVPVGRVPSRVFRTRFVSRLSDELGRMFYSFAAGDPI